MKKQFILVAFAALLLVSCGGNKAKKGIDDVTGRWFVYMDAERTEVDSTAYFEFFDNKTYVRHFHDAALTETGTYATDDTKKDYGVPSRRVDLTNQADERYFLDIVEDGKDFLVITRYQMNSEKEDIESYSFEPAKK